MSDPFIKQNIGHRVESGTSCEAQGKVDYAITTDNDQGIVFYENGNLLIRNKATSKELCGEKITDDKTPAKTIDAANGDRFNASVNGGWDYLKQLWKAKSKLVGKMATVCYFNITPDGKPRFPKVNSLS